MGYLIAGFAEAVVPHQWLSSILNTIGAVPGIGYALLLLLGAGHRHRHLRLLDGQR